MNDTDRLWSLMGDQQTCMMITATPDGRMRGRPMHAILEQALNEIWFYTRLKDGKCDEVENDAQICLTFGCPKSNDYVSVSGAAQVRRDPAMIHKHWSRFVDAWFPEGPDGPEVGMICVRPEAGEYWDGESSSVLAALKMLRASATDETPDLGEHGAVAMR